MTWSHAVHHLIDIHFTVFHVIVGGPEEPSGESDAGRHVWQQPGAAGGSTTGHQQVRYKAEAIDSSRCREK